MQQLAQKRSYTVTQGFEFTHTTSTHRMQCVCRVCRGAVLAAPAAHCGLKLLALNQASANFTHTLHASRLLCARFKQRVQLLAKIVTVESAHRMQCV
jgi:hypothetical protein